MSQPTVQLSAALDIAHAGKLKTTLDAALAGEKTVTLDAAGVSRVDAAGLQLLLAFVRQCAADGIAVSWLQVNESLREGAVGLGLAQALQLQLPNQEAR